MFRITSPEGCANRRTTVRLPAASEWWSPRNYKQTSAGEGVEKRTLTQHQWACKLGQDGALHTWKWVYHGTKPSHSWGSTQRRFTYERGFSLKMCLWRETESSCMCWFTSQMATMAGAASVSRRSAGAQGPGPCSSVLPGHKLEPKWEVEQLGHKGCWHLMVED